MELLTTDRFTLRHWDDGDLDAFADLYSRWEVVRWLGPQPRRPVQDLDEARDRLQRWQAVAGTVEPPHGLWALVPAGERSPAGTVLLLPLRDADGPSHEVEVGWHLHPDHQGRGLATLGARELLDRAASAGHRRVLALTDDDNLASQAVCRRLGMDDEGLTGRWFGETMRQWAWSPPGA